MNQNVLVSAFNKAQSIINVITGPQETMEDIRARFEKMTKKELVEFAVNVSKPKTVKITVESLAYAVLGDPDCAWLSYEAVANIINNAMVNRVNNKGKTPQTTKACMAWYVSHANEKGYDVVPRKSAKELQALLMEAHT